MDDFLTASAVGAGAGSVILTLSALGIYGVVGLMVATRTRELAVRLALGASRRRVLAMVLFDVVKLVMPGVVIGVILTAALVRLNGENMGIPLSNVEPVAYVARRRDRSARRGAGQPRPCAPRRIGPADGGHARVVGLRRPRAVAAAALWRGKMMTPRGSSMTQQASPCHKVDGIARCCSGTHLGLVTALIPRSVLTNEWNTAQPPASGGSASSSLRRAAFRARPGIRLLAHRPR
jgi:hypothetical protein